MRRAGGSPASPATPKVPAGPCPCWRSGTGNGPGPRTGSAGLKDTGLTNLPYHGFAANQIWLEIIALATDLLAWTHTLAFATTAAAHPWEPK